jgi:PPOX class probable F420-dependent enzyme
MEVGEARERMTFARVARLATVAPEGAPYLVPICFAVEADTIYNAVDHKPKRGTRLRRLSNVAANASACVLADHYDDADWSALWWARADGSARVLAPGSPEARRALLLLCARYAPYRETPPSGPVLALEVQRWSGWRAKD